MEGRLPLHGCQFLRYCVPERYRRGQNNLLRGFVAIQPSPLKNRSCTAKRSSFYACCPYEYINTKLVHKYFVVVHPIIHHSSATLRNLFSLSFCPMCSTVLVSIESPLLLRTRHHLVVHAQGLTCHLSLLVAFRLHKASSP